MPESWCFGNEPEWFYITNELMLNGEKIKKGHPKLDALRFSCRLTGWV